MRPPVVWVLKAKMKWVTPLRIMSPAEDEGDGEAGDGRDEDGEESGEDEEDAEGDGPVDGFGGEAGEGGWCCAHVVLQKS